MLFGWGTGGGAYVHDHNYAQQHRQQGTELAPPLSPKQRGLKVSFLLALPLARKCKVSPNVDLSSEELLLLSRFLDGSVGWGLAQVWQPPWTRNFESQTGIRSSTFAVLWFTWSRSTNVSHLLKSAFGGTMRKPSVIFTLIFIGWKSFSGHIGCERCTKWSRVVYSSRVWISKTVPLVSCSFEHFNDKCCSCTRACDFEAKATCDESFQQLLRGIPATSQCGRWRSSRICVGAWISLPVLRIFAFFPKDRRKTVGFWGKPRSAVYFIVKDLRLMFPEIKKNILEKEK